MTCDDCDSNNVLFIYFFKITDHGLAATGPYPAFGCMLKGAGKH